MFVEVVVVVVVVLYVVVLSNYDRSPIMIAQQQPHEIVSRGCTWEKGILLS